MVLTINFNHIMMSMMLLNNFRKQMEQIKEWKICKGSLDGNALKSTNDSNYRRVGNNGEIPPLLSVLCNI